MKQNWEYKRLGEVFQTSSGGTPSKSHPEYYEDGTIPWLRSGEIAQGYIYDAEIYITQKGVDNSSAKMFPIETVVIAMYGATVGQVGILKKEMCTNQAVCGIFPNDLYSNTFLKYALSAQKKNYLKLAVGGAQPNISQQIVKETLIPFVDISTQTAIVSELDALSAIIADHKSLLKKYDELEQSIFYHMFGDPVKNDKGWVVKKIYDIYSLKAGKTIKANELSEEPSEGLYPCYGGNGLRGYIAKKSHSGSYPIIGRQGALCGNVNFAEGEFYATEHAVVVSNKIGCIPLFSYFLLTNMKLERLAKGVAQPGLSVASVNEESAIVPPLPLQQEFALKIEAIEAMKADTKKSLAKSEELFNARMDYYFNA